VRTVHKYEVEVGRLTVHNIPGGLSAKLLHVGMQDHSIYLWFEVDDQERRAARSFVIYGTGWKLNPDEGKVERLIAAVQADSGMVWHVYEVLPT